MIFNQADNFYLGGIAQDKVYLGDTLIWPMRPKFPEPLFETDFYRGFNFFIEVHSGDTLWWTWDSDDCEGEGGNLDMRMEDKNGNFPNIIAGYGSIRYINENHPITFKQDFSGWLKLVSGYDLLIGSWGNIFNYATAMVQSYYNVDCGPTFNYPDIPANNRITFFGYNDEFRYYNTLYKDFNSLSYFWLNLAEEEWYRTYDIRHISFTADSMKFLEYYANNVELTITQEQYNSGIIDWDLANKNSITFVVG